jgi:hypothetical protein
MVVSPLLYVSITTTAAILAIKRETFSISFLAVENPSIMFPTLDIINIVSMQK